MSCWAVQGGYRSNLIPSAGEVKQQEVLFYLIIVSSLSVESRISFLLANLYDVPTRYSPI
jgi:hypothetical protein